jgi:Icc protein
MPYLLDTRPSRRTFLTRTGAALAGAAGLARTALAGGPADAEASAASAVRGQAPGRPLRLALLSDTHVPADPTEAYRGFRPVDNLRQVAAQVAATDVEGAIIAGDLARLVGLPDDYAALRGLLKPVSDRVPVGLVLGNHDDRRNFAQAFPPAPDATPLVPNKHVLVIEREGLRFVLLDSLLAPNVTPGQLGNQQRAWLRSCLEGQPPLPTAIVVHHTLDDQDMALVDSHRLFEVLRPFPQVKAIVYGHSHRYHVEERDGLQLINLPAVGYNFADSEPVGWIDSTWRADGVSLTLHAVGGNREADGSRREVRWVR